ncbi:MAG: hypothetical protein R3Y64_09645 [Peptostreptococcaceae bacterium]
MKVKSRFLLAVLTLFMTNTVNIFADGKLTPDAAIKAFQDFYNPLFNVFYGFTLLTNILIFIYHFTRLGVTSTNPQARSKTLSDIMISGACLALIGGGGLLYALMFGVFSRVN